MADANHVCKNEDLIGGDFETDRKGNIVAVVYTCSVCNRKVRKRN